MNAEEYEYYDEEDDENVAQQPKSLEHEKRETLAKVDKEKEDLAK